MKAGALASMAVFASVVAGSLYAQQELSFTIDGKDVKIRGCVTPVRGSERCSTVTPRTRSGVALVVIVDHLTATR